MTVGLDASLGCDSRCTCVYALAKRGRTGRVRAQTNRRDFLLDLGCPSNIRKCHNKKLRDTVTV
jgi:hypothetical protein